MGELVSFPNDDSEPQTGTKNQEPDYPDETALQELHLLITYRNPGEMPQPESPTLRDIMKRINDDLHRP